MEEAPEREPELERDPEPATTGAAQQSELTHNPSTIPQQQQTHGPSKGIFNYVNPFDQLQASTPRNRTPSRPGSGAAAQQPRMEILKHGRQQSVSSADGLHADGTVRSAKTRKLSPAGRLGEHTMASIEKETVANVTSQVKSHVGEEVELAMAKLDIGERTQIGPGGSTAEQELDREASQLAEEVRQVAAEVNEELKNPEARRALQESISKPLADALQDTVQELAEGSDAQHTPFVYNFPMRPFVSIEIQNDGTNPTDLRDDIILDVSLFKKGFDQMDRNLCTATKEYMAWALVKSGFRVVHQDKGLVKKVFDSSGERIFNIAICSNPADTAATEIQSVIATGIKGTVYWTNVAGTDPATFDESDLDRQGLIFPPVPLHDENTSGGQLKTRAKPSARHPEFFAIGRGKHINIIWPWKAREQPYTNAKTRRTNAEKYLKDYSLRIYTNKASKDFCWSDDDTVIASLDKAGKLKLWDVQELTNAHHGHLEPPQTSAEVREPMITLQTFGPSEKFWPTSVTFLDKERPYVRGAALRYIMVGMKQNHMLQLWDLALAKPVQELEFPHYSETDAACSVCFHPKTGVVVLGHPTRNSIYFIYLSSPRYNLPTMSQAKFLSRLVTQDTALPRPDSTAIMSGIREMSFASKGELRSVDILPSPSKDSNGEGILFELYVTHSKGITCLKIKNEDLGWDENNKVLYPRDAEVEGAVRVNQLSMPPSTAPSEAPSTNGDQTPQPIVTPAKVARDSSVKRSTASQNPSPAARSPVSKAAIQVPAPPVTEDSQVARPNVEAAMAASKEVPAPNVSTQPGLEKVTTPGTSRPDMTNAMEAGPSSSSSWAMADVDVDRLASNVSAEVSKVLNQTVDQLYTRLADERRVQEAAGAAQQDAVLRLVSSTLNNNVEKNLHRMIISIIQEQVTPAVTSAVATVATRAVEQKLFETLNQHISSVLPREMKNALPLAISRAIQDPGTQRSLTDDLTTALSGHVKKEFTVHVTDDVLPEFQKLHVNETQRIVNGFEDRFREVVRRNHEENLEEMAKIDELSHLVQGLTETITTLTQAQTNLQRALVEMHHQVQNMTYQQSTTSVGSNVESRRASRAMEDPEMVHIASMMNEGKVEEATVQWLQSPRQSELFEKLFLRLEPHFLTNVSPLVALSSAAAVSATLEIMPQTPATPYTPASQGGGGIPVELPRRLAYIETVLENLDTTDPDIHQVVPRIMDVISQRLQALYMSVAEREPGSAILRRISVGARKAVSLRGR